MREVEISSAPSTAADAAPLLMPRCFPIRHGQNQMRFWRVAALGISLILPPLNDDTGRNDCNAAVFAFSHRAHIPEVGVEGHNCSAPDYQVG